MINQYSEYFIFVVASLLFLYLMFFFGYAISSNLWMTYKRARAKAIPLEKEFEARRQRTVIKWGSKFDVWDVTYKRKSF